MVGNSCIDAEPLSDPRRHPTDAASANGRTALHEAAVWGDTTLVRQLLSAKADVTATDGESLQPSHVAALHGHQQVLELLLRAMPTRDPDLPKGLLHRAVMQGHTSLAEFVLNMEIAPDVSEPFGPEGAQPLHFAAKAGHAEAVDFLLGRRAGLESISKTEGFTAMHFAAAMGHVEVTKALMKRGCRQVKEKRGLLPIHLAVKANSPALVQELMKESLPSDLAHFSAEGGRKEVLRKVLRSRPNLGRNQDSRGFRPLHMAALAGHLDILDLLVREEGLPVGDADTQGFTAVHFAAKSGHRATVRHLAAMKADLKVRSKDGTTAWDVARKLGHSPLDLGLPPKAKAPSRPLRPIPAERFADKSPPETDAGLLQQVLALLDVTGPLLPLSDGRLADLLEQGGLKNPEERLHWLHSADGVETMEDAFARAVYLSKADVA
ncbi:ANK3 [Symbiodinium microadriaticum]|nr:ANK3 [Symbiodinium microadriaticum]